MTREASSSSSSLSRRQFHRAALLAATASFTSPLIEKSVGVDSPTATPPSGDLIDTNVYLGQWPFRHSSLERTAALVAKLRKGGVTEAWAGSFDALLHKDILAVNERLADECAKNGDGLLLPVGCVNLSLPGWEEALHRCVKKHGMKAIRIHPNYHGYTLRDPVAVRFFELASEARLLVQIPLVMEDERTIHPLVNVPPVDVSPLAELLSRAPHARVQLLNSFRSLRGLPIESLAARGIVYEIAMLEGVESLSTLLPKLPADRMCFGSYSPFFYFESASLKLRESVLDDNTMQSLRYGTARKLLA